MGAKIRLETDNQTRPGFNEAVSGLKEMADKAGITTNAAKELSKALDRQKYKEFREEVARVSAEMSGTVRAMSAAEQQAHDLNKELESRKAAAYRQEIKRLADELDGTAAAARKAQAALDRVKGPGNSASGGGGASIGGLSPSVMSGMSNAMAGIGAAAAGAAVAVIAVVKGLEAAHKAAEAAAFVLNELKEHGNEDAADLVDAFGEVKEALLDIGNDPVFRQMLVDAAILLRENIIPAIGELTRTYTDSVDYTTKVLIEAQRMLGLISQQEAQDQKRALGDATRARDQNNAVQVAKEKQAREDRKNADAIKKAADELARQEKDAAELQAKIDRGHAEWQEKQDAERAARLKEQVEVLQRQQELADKKVADAKLQALADELERKEQIWQREAEELAKKQAALADPVKKLIDTQDPRKTREQFVKNRLNKELAGFDQEADARIEAAAGGDKAPLRRQLDRERAMFEKRTRFNAFKQFDTGRARDDEVSQAVTDVAQGQVDTMRGQGQINDVTSRAMAGIIKTQQEIRQEQAEQQATLEYLEAASYTGAVNKRLRAQQLH